MKKFIVFLVISLSIIFIYARFIEVNNFKVREYSIIDNRLPEEFNGYKIIHISDVFYNDNDLNKIIERINLLKPDLVVFTGDLIKNDISSDDLDKLVSYLNSIDSKYGIYYVLGDNDYGDNFNYVMNNVSFNVLDNEYVYLFNNGDSPIMLFGVGNEVDNEKLFNYEVNDCFKIVLAHKPDVFESLNINDNDYADLFLAGHSLNGQIRLPFVGSILFKDGARKYYDEKYVINNTSIFISNGLGNENYDLRLFNTPSINFYRLYNK